ncbi:MAG: sugar ABC transporter substrate-binding protein [Deltaproteobacteria bacterium]|nr:sugar ABC transporter substrate-binding protein [Deltaproteobacteria bacterium]
MKRLSFLFLPFFLALCILAPMQGLAQAPPAEYKSGINWRAYQGQTINVLFSAHPWQEAIMPFIPEFEALTGIKVNASKMPHDEMLVKIPAGFASGTLAYDAFMGRYYDSPKFTMEKWTASIKEFLEDPKYTDPNWYNFKDFFPAAQSITMYGSYQDRLPITAEASILVYRKDIYQELGLKAPATFEELLQTVKKISDSKKAHGITVRGGPALWMPLYGMIRSYGGDWFTKDDVVKINSPESVAAVKMLAELAKYAPPGIAGSGWDQINTAMLSGVAATFIDSSVIYPRLMDPQKSTVVGKIACAPYLTGPAGRVSNGHFWSITMANTSTKKPASWYFLQWATSKPMQKKVALKGVLPPRASIWQDSEFTKAYQPDFIDAMNVTMKTAVCLPSGTKAGLSMMGLLDLQTRKVQEVILGQKEAKPAMDELAAEYNKVIQGQR